jgi:hypothetical protein
MNIAALVISIISLIASLGCLVIMLAKNYFSTHQVQMVPVDPFKAMEEGFPSEIGKAMKNPFREIGDPIDDEELEHLENLRKKKQSKI